jgi:hypothetical protein
VRIWLGIVTIGWAAVLVTQIGTWSAAHAVPLQGRNVSVSLAPSTEWRAVHVLVDGCACSRTVAAYLRRRGPRPGWQEHVWILGATPPEAIPGFGMTTPDEHALRDSGLTGGPRLLLFSPAGRLVWTGGYGPGKPRSTESLLDVQAMNAIAAGQTPRAVPVFGCPRLNPYSS